MMYFSVCLTLHFLLLDLVVSSVLQDNDNWWWNAGLKDKQPDKISFIHLMKIIPENKNYFAVNIGANDGIDHDPVYDVFKYNNYSGLVFEGDTNTFSKILTSNMRNVNQSKGIQVIFGYQNPVSIIDIFEEFSVPKHFDILKIDIDSIDYPLLRSILASLYLPRLVMVEVNPGIPPPFYFHVERIDAKCKDSVAQGIYGMSTMSAFSLMSSYGYRLVEIEFFDPLHSCQRCEHNAWFVHSSLVDINIPIMTVHDMISMYWRRDPKHLHFTNKLTFDPVEQVSIKLCGNTTGLDASLSLMRHINYNTSLAYVNAISTYARNVCLKSTIVVGIHKQKHSHEHHHRNKTCHF